MKTFNKTVKTTKMDDGTTKKETFYFNKKDWVKIDAQGDVVDVGQFDPPLPIPPSNERVESFNRYMQENMVTINNAVYARCGACHRMVRLNKPVIGSLHICD